MLSNIDEYVGEWDYRTLPANIQLGEGCWIERRDAFARFRSTRNPGLILGNNVRAYTWTAFNAEANGCIEVGDGSPLVGALFMCAESIRLGRQVVVSYNVTIADCDFHPRDPELRKLDAIANAPGGDLNKRPHSGIYIGTMFELGPEGEMEIGDYCAIVGPIISTNRRIVIGDYAFISYGVVLADSPHARPFESSDLASPHPTSDGAEIVLGENVWIGARAILLPGARIGEGAIIGAAAVVDFPVPPYAVVAGNPARVVGSAGPRGPETALGPAPR